jgi:outer membrane protein assembly factor BamB
VSRPIRVRVLVTVASAALAWAGIPAIAAPPAIAAASPDWPVYHRDAGRSGYDPSFLAVQGTLKRSWAARLDGAVYAEPLVVQGWLIAATEGDSVYALDPATGRVHWRRHLGTPVPLADLPCGNINPLGITSTPAYDAATRSLFVVAEVTGPRHILYALDPATGRIRWSRGVDVTGGDPRAHQQRAALAVGNGYVYAGFGGLAGDCGNYQGKVVGVPTTGHGPTIAYRVPVQREGGIWSPAGPVLDGRGNLYVAVGNGSSTTSYDGSDSVLELSSSLHLLSRFAPSSWAHDNTVDADLGSMTPVLLPNGFVFISGKNGQGYVLRQGALGGIGGQITSTPVCRGFGGASRTATAVFVPCEDGIRKVVVRSDGSVGRGWRTTTGADGPPVVGGGAVWTIRTGAGVLYALNVLTGGTVAQLMIGAVPHFATPTLWNGRVYIGTMTGIIAVRPTGP